MNPAVRDWKDQGGKVVGYFCSHVPTEVVMAAGLLPFRMRGTGSTGTELSDAFFSSINCSFPRHTFNQALKGEYDFLDGLLCISSCDHVRRVYDNWKRNLPTPFVKIMSLPKKIGDPQVEWYRDEINLLRSDLEKHFGVQISDERLRAGHQAAATKPGACSASSTSCEREASADHRRRSAGRDGRRQRHAGRALQRAPATACSTTLKALERHARLPRPLDDRGQRAGRSGVRRVIEEQGGLVVTDSICFGTRTMWVDVDEQAADPVEALARYYIQERPIAARA